MTEPPTCRNEDENRRESSEFRFGAGDLAEVWASVRSTPRKKLPNPHQFGDFNAAIMKSK
jgi:hypothetical protein